MEEIAAVYARSLFEVARDQDKLDEVREQVGQVADALDANRELAVFLFSPYFSTQEKENGLEALLDGADPALVNFLKLLIQNHRMPFIFRVRREYDALWREEHRLVPVQGARPAEVGPQGIRHAGGRSRSGAGRAGRATPSAASPNTAGPATAAGPADLGRSA